MGMYDTVNGEQVKCFPWVSLYNEGIDYHGGSLKSFCCGDEIPYKAPHYNYGKNFVILDYNRFPESDYTCYDYILHTIADGKVVSTFKDELGKIDWSKNELVVGYYGELLNINSDQDVLDFIKDRREYLKKYDELNSHWNELLFESMKYFSGIGLLDKDSEEKRIRCENLDRIHKLMEEEKERIKPIEDALKKEMDKWFVDTSSIEDCIILGDCISAYNMSYKDSTKEKEYCKEMICKLLKEDGTLYDRYVKWQGTDEYINMFLQK